MKLLALNQSLMDEEFRSGSDGLGDDPEDEEKNPDIEEADDEEELDEELM